MVANTCAFIEAAREESIETVLELADASARGARLVVTGCMAERYGDELAAALPEVDLVAGFSESLTALGTARRRWRCARARPPPSTCSTCRGPRPAAPWAYVKIAEGCDRRCGFCAIPTFRGDQRSRSTEEILAEARALVAGGVQRDRPDRPGPRQLGPRPSPRRGRRSRRGPRRRRHPAADRTDARRSAREVERVRLLLPLPLGTHRRAHRHDPRRPACPTSTCRLQHSSRPMLRAMRRWGDGERFLERIAAIRAADRDATFRSSFILGYPGETEDDQRDLLEFIEAAQLDWAGFFTFSRRGRHATPTTWATRCPTNWRSSDCARCSELQDEITARRRDALVGTRQRVLIDAPGVGRSVRECPEIDGIVMVDPTLRVGSFAEVRDRGEPRDGCGGGARYDDARTHLRRDRAASPRPTCMTIFRLAVAPVFMYMIIMHRISWWTTGVGLPRGAHRTTSTASWRVVTARRRRARSSIPSPTRSSFSAVSTPSSSRDHTV